MGGAVNDWSEYGQGAGGEMTWWDPRRACPQDRGPEGGTLIDRNSLTMNFFPTSPVTLILEARPGPDLTATDRWQQRLGELCAVYRPSIVRWMACNGMAGDTEDLAHDFLERWLAGNPLGTYERGASRFRDFLKTSLRNFKVERMRWLQREKRGGGVVHVDCAEIDLAVQGDDCAADLDLLLVRQVALRALRSIEAEWEPLPVPVQRELLRRVMAHEEVAYADLASLLGVTVNATRLRVGRLRQAYLKAFLAEVRTLCRNRADADREQRVLLELFCREVAPSGWLEEAFSQQDAESRP